MWCVAELDNRYIANMEDVLAIYEKAHNPEQPVVCLDEKPITIHGEARPATAAKPGREARRDSEYERRGRANAFLAVEPKAGRHLCFPTPDRSGFQFAQVALELALSYPEAKRIHLVMDNLNIHTRKSLTDVFGWWKLAQSGGDRDWHLSQAAPGQTQDSGPPNLAPTVQGMDQAHQLGRHEDQLEVRPQNRAEDIRLQKELFQAVRELDRAHSPKRGR